MTRISRRDFLKFMGAGASVLTFGRFFQHAQSLPNNSTSKEAQQLGYVTNNLVSSNRGTLPVILTCPHDGNQQPPGVNQRTDSAHCNNFRTLPDSYTRIITAEVAQSIFNNLGKAPYVVLAEFARKYIDANREPACAYESPNAEIYYNEYHSTIHKFVDEIRAGNNGAGFLFDIHASVVFPDDPADVYLGTNSGSTIKHLLQADPNAMWGNFSLNHYLTSAGFVVSPKLPGEKEQHLDGGYTVQTYGSSSAGGIDAIQIEMAPSIRSVIEKRQVLVQTLAFTIGNIVNHYA
jgi:N-formylglutamate amidohydrolase